MGVTAMGQLSRLRKLASLFAVITIVYALKTRQSHGRFLRVPFEFRVPTPQRIRQRLWNPDEESIVTPQAFGVGWTLNLYQVVRRLGFIGKGIPETGQAESTDEPQHDASASEEGGETSDPSPPRQGSGEA